MAASPPEKTEVEQTQSGEDEGDMSRQDEGAQGAGLGDFEVKEQDRWLPIANGWSIPTFHFSNHVTLLHTLFVMLPASASLICPSLASPAVWKHTSLVVGRLDNRLMHITAGAQSTVSYSASQKSVGKARSFVASCNLMRLLPSCPSLFHAYHDLHNQTRAILTI